MNPSNNTTPHPPLWRWADRKSGGTAPRRGSVVPQGRRTAFPSWRNRLRPLWIEIRFVGGAEGEVRVSTRGWDFAFPGNVTLLEMLATVNGCPPPKNG